MTVQADSILILSSRGAFVIEHGNRCMPGADIALPCMFAARTMTTLALPICKRRIRVGALTVRRAENEQYAFVSVARQALVSAHLDLLSIIGQDDGVQHDRDDGQSNNVSHHWPAAVW
jgi:hypothetical protein